MSRLIVRATVEASFGITLTEAELRALEALAGYGTKPFLDVFFKHMGEAYLRPHEAGLISLFDAISTESPRLLDRADRAREAFAATKDGGGA